MFVLILLSKLTKNHIQLVAMHCLWVALRLRNPLIRRHVLFLTSYADMAMVGFKHRELFEYVVFRIDNHGNDGYDITSTKIDLSRYFMQVLRCADDMRDLRLNLKTAYKTSALGHVYVVNEKIPMYACLNEWYVQSHMEIYQLGMEIYVLEMPHVIVFDLDSTLITDETNVNIRDEFVYDSLAELKTKGFILMLWSYGDRDHVAYSMDRCKLQNYFDVVICGGHKTKKSSSPSTSRVLVDNHYKRVFVDKPFFLDLPDGKRLPKSPRIVLWYLRKQGINYIKSITLVDDLAVNNHGYDYFVHVNKCPEPINDWQMYHDIIVNNVIEYESMFNNIDNKNVFF
ncbi:ORF88 [Helicoverpa armigera SNPV]|nr:ORF88 [Helicoverpa armigera SNPV]